MKEKFHIRFHLCSVWMGLICDRYWKGEIKRVCNNVILSTNEWVWLKTWTFQSPVNDMMMMMMMMMMMILHVDRLRERPPHIPLLGWSEICTWGSIGTPESKNNIVKWICFVNPFILDRFSVVKIEVGSVMSIFVLVVGCGEGGYNTDLWTNHGHLPGKCIGRTNKVSISYDLSCRHHNVFVAVRIRWLVGWKYK